MQGGIKQLENAGAVMFFLKRGRPNAGADGRRFWVGKPFKAPAAVINAYYRSKAVAALCETTPDGVYEWILKSPSAPAGPPSLALAAESVFLAAPALSGQEVGSLHINLDMWTDDCAFQVFAAGELEKRGASVSFNLKSGTYMESVVTSLAARERVASGVLSFFASAFSDLRATFLECGAAAAAACKTEYELFSGQDIVQARAIVTPRAEVFVFQQFFTLENENDDDDEEGEGEDGEDAADADLAAFSADMGPLAAGHRRRGDARARDDRATRPRRRSTVSQSRRAPRAPSQPHPIAGPSRSRSRSRTGQGRGKGKGEGARKRGTRKPSSRSRRRSESKGS